ncbi:unnamed protein product [Dracunculus medinensis]|uniref:Deltameth_res domain-containing protein n=1 Tax=Dracunculus medinensis TaxID=318479 RepID=A0A158Q460_DRAME|nr:unnamed protein product [Dracunculus medinensis]
MMGTGYPGPPVTMDSIPVPFMPYKTVHRELQAKFNKCLIFGIVFYTLSLSLAFYDGVFMVESLRTPLSYRYRNKSNK